MEPGSSKTPSLGDKQTDHKEEINNIIKLHLPWIQNFVHKKLGAFRRSKADTGDIVQEATIQFLQYGPRVHLMDERQFRALLCKIVENVIRDKYDWFTACRRNLAKERPLPSDTILILDPTRSSQDTPSQIVQKHEEEAWLRLGLELLDPEKRQVIVLHHWEDMSFIKIGALLGISKDAARMRFVKALHLLNENVESIKKGGIEAVLGPDYLKEMDG